METETDRATDIGYAIRVCNSYKQTLNWFLGQWLKREHAHWVDQCEPDDPY